MSRARRERQHSVFSVIEFQVSETEVFRYTDADEDVIGPGGFVFSTEVFNYPEIVVDGTLRKSDITIETRQSLPVSKLFRREPPSYVCTAKIWESNFADPNREFRLVWAGRVLNCRIEEGKSVFSCQSAATTLARPGLKRYYQKPCPHALYGPQCRAARVEEEVSWVSGSASTWIVTQPTGFVDAPRYEAGLVVWVEQGFRKMQTILRCEDFEGNLVLTLNRALVLVEEPKQVRLVKGCNHTETACIDWHSNIVNYGGCNFQPETSPLEKFSTYF